MENTGNSIPMKILRVSVFMLLEALTISVSRCAVLVMASCDVLRGDSLRIVAYRKMYYHYAVKQRYL